MDSSTSERTLGYYETAPEEYSLIGEKPGCATGGCKWCYNGSPRWQWGDQMPLFDATRDYLSVRIDPWAENDPESQARFLSIDWPDLTDEFVGGPLRGDAGEPSNRWGLKYIEPAAEVARVLWFSSRAISALSPRRRKELLICLFRYKHFRLLLGFPGNRKTENIQPEQHLRTIAEIYDMGMIKRLLVLAHPYLLGDSDWSHLDEFERYGIVNYSVRGFSWEEWMDKPGKMPSDLDLSIYRAHKNDGFYLPTEEEDPWRQRLADHGIRNVTIFDWMCEQARELPSRGLHGNKEKALELSRRTLKRAQLLGFGKPKDFLDAAVARRTVPCAPAA